MRPRTGAGRRRQWATWSLVASTAPGGSVDETADWSGETPAVGDVVARGIDGARR